MRSRILALLLALSIVPSAMELVELVVHWAEHGDLAHAERDRHDTAPLGADEHGCSGTFHLCSCHTVNAVPPALAPVVNRTDCDGRSTSTVALDRAGEGAPAPPIRPPIA
ncbi:MAG: hypothetical protein ACTHU0_12985 [Kofleriaceae bacterium]